MKLIKYKSTWEKYLKSTFRFFSCLIVKFSLINKNIYSLFLYLTPTMVDVGRGLPPMTTNVIFCCLWLPPLLVIVATTLRTTSNESTLTTNSSERSSLTISSYDSPWLPPNFNNEHLQRLAPKNQFHQLSKCYFLNL